MTIASTLTYKELSKVSAHELNIEVQGRVRWDPCAAALRSIGKLRWACKDSLLSELHRLNGLFPALNNFLPSDSKLVWLALWALVEDLASAELAGVGHFDFVTNLRVVPCACVHVIDGVVGLFRLIRLRWSGLFRLGHILALIRFRQDLDLKGQRGVGWNRAI